MDIRKSPAIIIPAIIIAVSLSGCGKKTDEADKLPGNNGEKPDINMEKRQESNPVAEEELKTSLRDLLARNKAVECSFDTEDKESSAHGKFFLDAQNKKMFNESKVKSLADGKELTVSSIMDGDMLYTWNSMQAGTGMKMKIEDDDEKGDDNSKEDSLDLDEQRLVKCVPWEVDASRFAIPENIKFMDLSAELDSMKTGANAVCSACGLIPDEKTKAECLKTNGCK